jgi:hypothetical protein
MKIFSWLTIVAACAFLISCEKPANDVDRNAQVEKEVQARLDAEHQTQEQQRLAQQQADLDAREKALAAKEAVPANTPESRIASPERDSSSEEHAPQSYDTFYRKLEPYGAWRESADYGYVWQPRAAQESRNWRPYTDGRWAYTDAGWTWISGEPFGWATYHYGRWTRLSDVGWVWVPGDEWAPAWVSWRTSDQHVGWAPLPPQARFEHGKGIHKWADSYYDIDAGEYVFVPNEDIGDENIQRAVIPAERNVTIVNETTNVTNITYSNTTIVNEGPNFDQLRGRSRRPVERLRLQREFNADREQNPRAVVSGETLQVITPLFNARVTERPHTSAPRIERANVEHLATTGDQAEAARARQKMKSEATPPPDAPAKKFEKPVAAATPAAPETTAAPVATATPVTSATVVMTPPPRPSASIRPTFTPRPVATATPLPTAVRATPAAPPIPANTVEPKPAQTAVPDQAVIRAEQQRKREEARVKALETNRGLRASPTIDAPPRQIAPPQPVQRQLPADMTDKPPSGIELTPTPRPNPKRVPQRALPPNLTPTPAGGREP